MAGDLLIITDKIGSNGHKVVAGSSVHRHGHRQDGALHIHRKGGDRQVDRNAGQARKRVDKCGDQDIAHFDQGRLAQLVQLSVI